MSTLESQLMADIKDAMRAKNSLALDALRAVKASISLLKIDEKLDEISSEQEIVILQRMIKQRKDSSSQFTAQNRMDLAEVEDKQILVIEKYLPKQLSNEELEVKIKKIIEDLGVTSIKEMGKVMAVASKELAGKSDGKSISEMLKKILN